jgi:hypothetical protein
MSRLWAGARLTSTCVDNLGFVPVGLLLYELLRIREDFSQWPRYPLGATVILLATGPVQPKSCRPRRAVLQTVGDRVVANVRRLESVCSWC